MSSPDCPAPIAIVLAGGLGTRIGGQKALALLGERPLISYPVAAARAAGLDVAVVAKPDTSLPPLSARLLIEPDEPRHPLCGIVASLEHFGSVLALPCDMPLLSANLLRMLADAAGKAAAPSFNGIVQPFPALYRRETLPLLREGLRQESSMRSVLAKLEPTPVLLDSDLELLSVNSAADLAIAAARLRTRG